MDIAVASTAIVFAATVNTDTARAGFFLDVILLIAQSPDFKQSRVYRFYLMTNILSPK